MKDSIATATGSMLHRGMELKGIAKMNNQKVDYELLKKIIEEGEEDLIGINEISLTYWDEWFKKDENTNMDMNDKMSLFFNEVLPTRMEDEEWEVIGTEVPFEYVYDERCIIHGFIDRIDRLKSDHNVIKVVDYKSSKKVFRDEDIKTPLQMFVYDLAVLHMYGVLPTHHEYDFILLNKKQREEEGVCTKGYVKRGIKKIDNILDSIAECTITGVYRPKPSPLCYWCEFAPLTHTPNADEEYEGLCPYYSLWTPDNRVFKTNKRFGEDNG